MANMKESGVEWVGEIPEEWGDCVPLRFCDGQDSKTSQFDAGKPYIALENVESWTGNILLANEVDQVDSTVATFSSDDVLFGKLRPYLAKVVRPSGAGQCSTELLPIQPKEHVRDYLFWLLINKGLINTIDSMTYGVKMPRTSWGQIGSIGVPVPPKEEQQAIAALLDQKCAAIDTTTNTLETQISTLERYRSSVIHEAVTRGLDPTAPTKPSGVEWFDAIPSNWTATRITAVAERHSGHTPNRTTPEYWDNGDIVWISLADSPSLRKQKYVYASKTLTTQAGINHSSAELLPAGSVLLSRDASVGLCAIAGCDLAVSQHFMAYVCGPKLNNSYLLYCLKDMQQVFHKLSMGSTIPTIGLPLIKRLAIPLPPREEQDAIVARLDARTAAIDAVIATKRKQLDVLKQRRQSLIYEYVTGKRRVGEEG